MTGWKVPVVKSCTDDTHSLCRSSDFGVNTTSGFFFGDSACRRSRWKWLAGVVGTATRMLSSAQICRYRSIRPEVWSGPCPSWPCGSSRVRAVCWPHFASPDEMNSSTTDCAPLAKSPNCASQSTSASRFSTEYPYSKPIAANSDSSESCTKNRAAADHLPLMAVKADGAPVFPPDSLLSQFPPLGFEDRASVGDLHALGCWEALFRDIA